ncbi:hypothetical protein Tco_0424195 [Tanacetum coccineum]
MIVRCVRLKVVPSAKRVKISCTNIRLETIVPQKEETFQVVIDIIKNSICFKAFTISVDVLKIFMQQFWYTIKKVPETDSYEFLLANKKCIINAEVFRTILDICPRVEGVNFADVPDDDTTLTFLIDLGYKGLLNRHTNMFVDHMHQPWRTLAAIINKCLSRKLASNDKLRKSRIDILWGIIVVKKKVTLSVDDNIISNDPDAALELAKSISQTEADKSFKSIVIQDTPSAPKLKTATSKAKLKGAPSLTPAEHEAANIMQALKERVPDKSTVVSATSSEGTGIKPGVSDEEKDIIEEKVILEWGYKQDSENYDDDNDDVEKDDKDGDADDEGDDHISDTQDADDEDVKTKSDEDDIYKYKIQVRKDEDVEMKDAKVKGYDKGNEDITDAAKEEAKNTLEAKDDTKKTELPPSSSSLSVSLGFGDQFLKLFSDSSLVITVKDSADVDVIAKLEKDVFKLKTVDHSFEALAVLQSHVLIVVDSYLDTKVRDVFQKELQKHTAYLIHKYSLQHLPELTKKPTPTAEQESEKSPSDILKIKTKQTESQKNPQFTIKSTDKAALEEYDLKIALY